MPHMILLLLFFLSVLIFSISFISVIHLNIVMSVLSSGYSSGVYSCPCSDGTTYMRQYLDVKCNNVSECNVIMMYNIVY